MRIEEYLQPYVDKLKYLFEGQDPRIVYKLIPWIRTNEKGEQVDAIQVQFYLYDAANDWHYRYSFILSSDTNLAFEVEQFLRQVGRGPYRMITTVTAVANDTPTSATLILDIVADPGYFLVGDEFKVVNSNVKGSVKTVSSLGGFQTITVSHPDAAAWAATTSTPNFKIGHIGNGFSRS